MYIKNTLTYILTSVQLNATGHHWVASLTNYNFTLRLKTGKVNVGADTLFHIPWKGHDWHIEADMVQILISNATQGKHFGRDVFLQYAGHQDLGYVERSKSHVAERLHHSQGSRPCDKRN